MTLFSSTENTGLNPMSFSDQQGSLVFERLRYQRETGRFCDVAIVVKNQQFAAHRNILASSSPYFDSIFKWAKITKEQVTVNCTNPSIFETLLNYMYSGTVIIDRSSVSELLRLANNLLITKLKTYCAEYLDRYLDAANCLSIRNLATKYNIPTLLRAASDYFDVNINRCLLESTDIVDYSYAQLIKLISDPKYYDVITADTYLKLIVRWVGQDLPSREITFRQLLEQCQIREVSADTLDFLLDYSSLLAKSQPSRFLLLHVMHENQLVMEKYASQLVSLRQQIGELPPLHDPMMYDEDDMSSDGSGEEDDYAVEGHPTAAQIIESENAGEEDHPRIRIKFNLGTAALDKKRFKKPKLFKRRRRQAKEVPRQENEMIPMVDDDDIDGVYATSSLEGAHTYGPADLLDPDDVEDGEDVPVENSQFMCIYCGFGAGTNEDLEKHKARSHNRNTYYLCHLCEFETNWSKEYYAHCHEHWPEVPFKCDKCPFVTTNSIQEYLAHRLTHTDQRYFKCGECAWKGRSRSQLFAHERMHSVLDNRPLHCEECGRGFQQHLALDQHVNSHNEIRSFICEECGFASKSVDHLALHRRQHTSDIFFCHIAGCDYSSTKKSQLAAHLRTHMAVRAHLCKVCGRGFIEKSHLVRHERIHLEDKPFKCDTCDYASSRRDKLKEHILKHHNGQTTAKAQRRRYKRQRMLAAAANVVQTNQMTRAPDALFRPIPTEDSVSRWAQDNDFSAYSPSASEFVNAAGMQGNAYSPPRAFSVTNPQIQPHRTMSPGCMSMMNVPIGLNDPQTEAQYAPSDHLGNAVNPHGALITPTVRSPHNRSADPFGGLNTPNEIHSRPMSLPTYGQMDMQQQQQQQQQNQHVTSQQQQSMMQLHQNSEQHQWW